MLFLIIFGVGFFLTVITFAIGELFDLGGDGAADAGGFDAHPSPFSSRILFVFITAFGGFGVIGQALGWPVWGSVTLAVAGGVGVAAGTFFLIVLPLSRQQGSTTVLETDFIESEGEVTAEIPAGGVGRVTVVSTASGARVARPARSVTGERVAFGTLVRVIHAGQGLMTVAPVQAEAAQSQSSQTEEQA